MTTLTLTPAPVPATPVQRLLDLSDSAFREAVTKDLEFTGGHKSPFQDSAVIRRTLTTLLERAHAVQVIADDQAENPEIDNLRYQRTLKFRRHLLAVIDITERRIDWLDGANARSVSAWKTALHELLDELEGGPEEDVMDELKIPNHNLTLRDWRKIRQVKDPRRVKVKDAE